MQIRDFFFFFFLNTSATNMQAALRLLSSTFYSLDFGGERSEILIMPSQMRPRASRAVTRGANPRPSSQQSRPEGSPISSYNAL